MKILVAYASRHGATQGIAERITQALERTGLEVELHPVDEVGAIDGYDAVVIGSAAYMGRWLKPATEFVRRNGAPLSERPVWLFSSGPIGTETVDTRGRNVLEASVPAEFAEFAQTVHPRGVRVFFGAYDPDAEPVGIAERLGAMLTRMPAVRQALPAGDFRDWPEIESWAAGIADDLRHAARTPATV